MTARTSKASTSKQRASTGAAIVAAFAVTFVVTGSGVLVESGRALADTPGAWSSTPYTYTAIDQDVRQVLLEFGRNLNVIVQIDEDIQGRARNVVSPGTAAGFIERLASECGFVWYFDGAVLHVNSVKDVVSRTFSVAGVSADRVRQSLVNLGAADPRWRWRTSSDGNLLIVTGPPSYLNLVEQVIAAMTPGHSGQVHVVRGIGGSDS